MNSAREDRVERPRPLPIRPRPLPDDNCSSYIRRLALANHMRPMHLRAYLKDPEHDGGFRLDWLAFLSGRPLSSLRYALTDLQPDPTLPHRPRRGTPAKLPKTELFSLIRRDASSGISVRALADRYGVGDRTVRQALQSPRPQPRKQYPLRRSRLEPFTGVIDTILEAERNEPSRRPTARTIFNRLVTEHGAIDISYSMVRHYVAHQRLTTQLHELPPAHQAVEDYDLARLRCLLDNGGDVNDVSGGKSLLHRALDVEHTRHLDGEPIHADITTFLLARGANRHTPMPLSTSALDHARQLGHWLATEIIQAIDPGHHTHDGPRSRGGTRRLRRMPRQLSQTT